MESTVQQSAFHGRLLRPRHAPFLGVGSSDTLDGCPSLSLSSAGVDEMHCCEVSMRLIACLVLLFASTLACGLSERKPLSKSTSNMTPPKAEINVVVDDYHGQKVADPYRWLEDAKSPQTQRFVEEENVYTQRVLDSIPGKDKL